MEKIAVDQFVLLDGKEPSIQHKTQFEKQDDMSHNFKWWNTTDYFEPNEQYKLTNKGKTLIISLSGACSLELDYRLIKIHGMSCFNFIDFDNSLFQRSNLTVTQ